jgi:hypothetical protein
MVIVVAILEAMTVRVDGLNQIACVVVFIPREHERLSRRVRHLQRRDSTPGFAHEVDDAARRVGHRGELRPSVVQTDLAEVPVLDRAELEFVCGLGIRRKRVEELIARTEDVRVRRAQE